MSHDSRRSYACYDTDDSLDEHAPTDPAMLGLPETWRHYGWMAAAYLFASLWLIEILTSGVLFNGVMGLDQVANEVWMFVGMLPICIGLLHFWSRPKTKPGDSPAASSP